MKAIIGGKRYDTDKATELFTCGSRPGVSRSDFGWWTGTVYRTKGGAYFLAGEGHAASRFAERVGDSWGAGEGVQTLTEREALAMAEQHADPDAVELHFGHLVEDARGPGRPEIGPAINIRLPQDLLDAIVAEQRSSGSASRAATIRALIMRGLADSARLADEQVLYDDDDADDERNQAGD